MPFLLLVLADVVILRDGTVLECKIREEKFTDPKNRSKFVLVVATDEKGTIRQIPNSEIKKEGGGYAVFRGKTSWERRAEYRVEYAKKAAAVKETWEARQQLGKWCKSRLLPDEAAKEFRQAYRLRAASAPDTIPEHLALAKWCDKELGLADESRREYRAAYELKKKEAAPVDVGRWCEQQGLTDFAVAEYEAAGDNSTAKSALARIRGSIEFRQRQLALEYDKTGRAWHFTVAIEENVDRKFLDEWAAKIQDLSDYIFVVTEGQFFIADCEIEDSSSDARIIVEKGKLGWRGLSNKEGTGTLAYCQGSGMPDWEVHAPGKSAVSVLAHEVFHGVFGLPDEYYQNPQCDCVMRSAPNPQKLCDGADHIGPGGKSCWDIIRSRKPYGSVVQHPNPAWRWLEPGRQTPGARGDHTDGARPAGGELTWQGMRLKAPPRTILRIIDN